jgi:acetolactate synthase-1/2/3 large subunit
MLSYPIRSQGRSDYVLLVSSQDHDTGGGLFSWDGRALEQVDRLSTGGLCVTPGRLFRSLWAALADAPGEVLVYDERGVCCYHRLDALAGAHDVLWSGRELIAVSTATNSVLWISPGGEVTRTWQAPGQGDAWHLNCLYQHGDRLLVSAFGRFARHRDWTAKPAEAVGMLFDLESGQDVLTGLVRPHHPRFVDGAWLVCNSAGQEVLHIEPETRAIRRRLALQGWTRGVAVTDDYLLIGESALRRDTGRWSTASIAVVCRRTWAVLDRIVLPCREVYDLVLAPVALLQGVRRGFRTNTQRAAEQDQHALFTRAGVQPVRLWATGDPLPPEACRVHIAADAPEVLEVDAAETLVCVVENVGAALLVTAPPNPVHLSYKWLEAGSGRWLREPEGLRTRLPHTLVPGRRTACRLRLWAPPTPGKYRLRITLVQEEVAWFDEVHPENASEHLVQVVTPQSLWQRIVRQPAVTSA